MKLIVPPLNISDDDGFDPEVDIFDRKVFGESLLNLIKNTDGELVLALDAPWGEGKSTFIKMWQGYLTQEGVSYIYFDAFENDYQQDAFLAISSQIYRLVDKGDKVSHKEFKEKAASALKVFGRASLRVGIKALTAVSLDETILEDAGSIGDASNEVSGLVDNYVANQLALAEEDRKSLQEFKKCLSSLSERMGGESPIVFIIDELDRCKPRFALSLIESIKHLFCVPNIIFLLVMNRSQIEEAVRCEYGAGVDATRYLQKFVSIWTTLPKPTGTFYSVPKKYLRDCLERMGYRAKTEAQREAVELMEELAIYYDLSLREIERSLTSFAIIQNVTNGDMSISHSLLSVFISIIKSTHPGVFRELSKNRITYEEVLEEVSLNKLKIDWWSDKPEGHPIRYLLKYYLGTDEEAEELLKKGKYININYGRDDRGNVIPRICSWLDEFKFGL